MGVSTILAWSGFVAFLLALASAFTFGGPAERRGASIWLVGNVVTIGLQLVSPGKLPYLPALAVDLGLAAAFTWLALKNPQKLWPGFAAVAQTLLAAFSATRAIGFPLSEQEYLAAGNTASLGVALAICGGVWASRRPMQVD